MAFSDNSKLDKSFKTLINKEFSTTAKAFYEEFGANTININTGEVWAENISSTPATAVSNGVARQLTQFTLSPVAGYTTSVFYLASGSGFTPGTTINRASVDTTLLQRNFIGDKYGTNYAVLLYDNAGNQIFATDAISWFFDYVTGILFIQNPGGYSTPYKVTVYQYTGKTLTSPTLSYSGSFSGSFQGNGSGLTNLPASSIVGLNLTQIADSQVSASVSATGTSFTVTSASVNLITVNSSSKVTATTFSGSLIGVSNTTGSLTGSFTGIGSGSFSGSFQGNTIGISNTTGSLTGSFQGSATGISNTTGSLTGSFIGIGSGSFSGSFQGNGGGLTNLPASSIVGLNLSQTATGSVTASVNVGATSFQVTSGSTTLLSLTNTGNLTVSGSEFIGNNITAIGNAVVTGSLTVNGVTNLGNTLIVNASSSLRDATVTGSLLVTQNLTVLGTASFTSITGSRIVIGSPTITLSTDTPAVRFGGMLVVDSGSFGGNSTGSLLWDSQEDRWIYVTPSGSTEGYNSAIIIGGPPNTGSIGSEPGLTQGRIMKAVGDDHIGSSLMRETGSAMAIDGTLSITGSTLLPSPDGTVTNKYTLVASQSAWHYSDNVGYPVGTNQWGTNLNGSYFNNFTPNTDTATILRFVAGLLSSSAPAALPNTKTYGSLANNTPSLNTGVIPGYVPQDISGSDLIYLNSKGFADTGSTLFSGVGTVYTTLNPTYNFTSVSTGTTTISSSADAQLFGLGATGLSFNVSGGLNWRFDDNYLQTSTATSSSQALATLSSFISSGGLTLAEIPTANPAVIPNSFQDGKFAGIFAATFFNGGRSLTSVSSSGWYHVSASIGYSTGSSQYQSFRTNFTKVFAAPTANIIIPTQNISFTQSVTTVTATSRSLSGAPYLQGATWTYTITSSGVFEPLYYGNSTIFNITDDNALVTLGGTTTQVMSSGNISGTSLVFSTSSVSRTTGTIPFRTDRLQSTNTATFTTLTGSTNIGQSTVSPTGYNITTISYDRNGTPSSTGSTILFHSASTFGQPPLSQSLAYFGSAQGYDGGSLTGTSETFSGETYRLQITDKLLSGSYTIGDKFTTGSYSAYSLTSKDLQVKPGYLVRPGGTYGYWLPNDGTEFKYYARAFNTNNANQINSFILGLTLSTGNVIKWNQTAIDGVACLVICSNSTGLNNAIDIKEDSLSTQTFTAGTNGTNPFGSNITVYKNTAAYPTVGVGGVFLLDGSNRNYVVLVRMRGDVGPITNLSITYP